MTFNVVEEDSAALQSVIDGTNDYNFHPIPVDRLGEVQNQYADQLKLYTPANTYYYFMNTRLSRSTSSRSAGRELRGRP